MSRAGPSFASYETCNDHVRDRRPCRLCRPGAGLRRGRCPAGSGARGDRAASRRDDVHARQSRSARSARRRKPQPPAIASATPWRYARAERRTARARSVAAGTMAREAFASRQTPRDRGRRSDRRADGEDGRRPDSPHGRGQSGKGGPLEPVGPSRTGSANLFPQNEIWSYPKKHRMGESPMRPAIAAIAFVALFCLGGEARSAESTSR